jgi:hypothetical protein
MFAPNSRYAAVDIYAITTRQGRRENATRLPIRPAPATRGFHRRTEGQRLDQIAALHLADATAFWRLCDASGAVSPDALGARDLVAIPSGAVSRDK